MSEERWVPVPGFEGLYEVSDQGRVWSFPRKGTYGQILNPYVGNKGYLHVALSRDGQQRSVPVHRVVAMAFHGPRPPEAQTRHLDGNKLNNRLENLVYGTRSENMRDAVRHGQNVKSNKTTCPRGHSYLDVTNLIIRRNGERETRFCRACQQERDARRSAERAARRQGPRTTCRRGHELSSDNVYVVPSRPNVRQCRECNRMAGRRNDPIRRARARAVRMEAAQ